MEYAISWHPDYKPLLMAELNPGSAASGRRALSNAVPKTDLTAMVDLAFLLITFFMLTTSLSQPTELPLAMPVGENPGAVADDRTMTVCLGDKNSMLWYMGTAENPININSTNSLGLRHAFMQQMKAVLLETGKPLIVLIKPGEKSKFKNLVDVLDELAIVKAPIYAIVDITAKDEELFSPKAVR